MLRGVAGSWNSWPMEIKMQTTAAVSLGQQGEACLSGIMSVPIIYRRALLERVHEMSI